MNIQLLILLLLLMLSGCASELKKFGPERHFYQKGFDMAGQETFFKVNYWMTKENDKHCFESNPQNKEIITVDAEYIEYAIVRFTKRVAVVDVKNVVKDNKRYLETWVKDDVNFKLETATCFFENPGGLFNNHKVRYISFRLLD